MDTSSFFAYPSDAPLVPDAPALAAGLLPEATPGEWEALLAACQARRFRPGEHVLRAGEIDRAVYLLADGQVRAAGGAVVRGPAVIGEAAFLDGLPRAVDVIALTDGEALRLSLEAWEALTARQPRLGRDLLLDLGRIAAGRLRATVPAGFTG